MTLQRKLFVFGFVTLSFLSLYLLGTSSVFALETSRLSPLITIDVLLTIPLIYFLLIRKTNIPKLSVIPVTVAGVILASYILPEENQRLLSLFKTWILPIVELFIVAYVLIKVRKTVKTFKENRQANLQADFYTILKQTSRDILPRFLVIPFATEIAVIYYGLINWKKRKLNSNEFTYHKSSGSIGLFIAFIIIIAVETVGVHYLLRQSSNIIGVWILTILSTYTGLQVIGFVKSILKRPIVIKNNTLYLRYGIMKETEIDIKTIASIEISSKDLEEKSEIKKISLLGNLESHNLIIHLKEPNTMIGLYGIQRAYKSLALSIDKKEEFKAQIENLLAVD